MGGYRADCNYWEDLDLFLRISRFGRVSVLAEELVAIRLSPASSRAVTKAETVEAAVDRMYASVAEVARGRGYEAIIRGPLPDGGLNPMVFVARGNHKLWSGGRPLILGSMFRRGLVRADRNTLMSLGWAGIAAVCPSLLRTILTFIVRIRNRAARRNVRPGSLHDWRPFGMAAPGLWVLSSRTPHSRRVGPYPLRNASALQE